MRGKQLLRNRHGPPGRLIPACAGKTLRKTSPTQADRAHPRVCGENAFAVLPMTMRGGSSPRVRGKLCALGPGHSRRGLIPACAGKTGKARRTRHEGWAHPRVCGENHAYRFRVFQKRGSSPRVRGKPVFASEVPDGSGLIPACAGKTRSAWIVFPRPGAHPRVCGENIRSRIAAVSACGSSPRVRGKLHINHGHARKRGLIPACAGKTGAACA